MNKKRPRRDDDREERTTMEIIVDAYNESEVWTAWYCYLENTLAFPFEAECVRSRKMSPLKPGERVTVMGMLDDDEGDGLGEMMVEAEWRDCTMGIPLAQIKGRPSGRGNRRSHRRLALLGGDGLPLLTIQGAWRLQPPHHG